MVGGLLCATTGMVPRLAVTLVGSASIFTILCSAIAVGIGKSKKPLFGFVAGFMGLLLLTFFPADGSYEIVTLHSRMMTSLKDTQAALKTSALEHHDDAPSWSVDPSENAFATLKDRNPVLSRQPTFVLLNSAHPNLPGKPVYGFDPDSISPSSLVDPFSPVKGAAFCYWTDATATTTATYSILWSAGPDRAYDLTLDNIARAYDARDRVPSDELISLTFDPSNGTASRGDIWKIQN